MAGQTRTARILSRIGGELKENPPSILAQTRNKKGKKAAGRQRTAILFAKARAAGADIQNA